MNIPKITSNFPHLFKSFKDVQDNFFYHIQAIQFLNNLPDKPGVDHNKWPSLNKKQWENYSQ